MIFDVDDDRRGAGLVGVVHFLLLCPGFAWSAASDLNPTKGTMSHQTGIQGKRFSSAFGVSVLVLFFLCEREILRRALFARSNSL